jgi:hypothetical protein
VRARLLPLQEFAVEVAEFDFEFLACGVGEFGEGCTIEPVRLPALFEDLFEALEAVAFDPDGFLTSSGIRSFCSSLLLPRLANRDKSGDGSLGALACQKFGASSVRSPIVEPLLLSSSSSSSRSACPLVIYLSWASRTSADPDFLSRPTRRRSSSPWSKPPGTLARRRYPLAVSRDLVPGARVA